MKIVELDTESELNAKALAEALKRALMEPHDGWAELVVYPSRLREAVKLSVAHNETKPALKVRTTTQQRELGIDDWLLRTKGVEIRVIREKA